MQNLLSDSFHIDASPTLSYIVSTKKQIVSHGLSKTIALSVGWQIKSNSS